MEKSVEKTEKSVTSQEIAISVKNVSKEFRIPHEKITSLKGAAVSVFKKKTYEEFKALDNVSFEVKKGEFFGIIGRNGSGKSTLLKILAGIYQADKGKVKVNGMISPFLELGIGFNPELSGRDNVYLNATVLGMSKKEIDEKFDSIVAFSELERFIDQKLKNYSSGMQVRLAFSVSIHANREILLMDEVLAVGDTNFQSKCLEEFNKYREMGRTVIIVTHDISVVQKYCDRAMLLRNGKVIMIGKTDQVTDEYVYENINDEQKRTLTTKSKNKIQEFTETMSHKPAEIVKVEFYNKDNELTNNIISHEILEVRIFYKINSKLNRRFNLGFSISSIEGARVLGCTTEIDEIILNEEKQQISLIFESMPLLKGSYFVNVTLYGLTNIEIFDFKPKINKFNVYSFGKEGLYGGFITAEHEWLLK